MWNAVAKRSRHVTCRLEYWVDAAGGTLLGAMTSSFGGSVSAVASLKEEQHLNDQLGKKTGKVTNKKDESSGKVVPLSWQSNCYGTKEDTSNDDNEERQY